MTINVFRILAGIIILGYHWYMMSIVHSPSRSMRYGGAVVILLMEIATILVTIALLLI